MQKNCLVCGNIFHKKISESKKYWETKKYCSVKCNLTITNIKNQKYELPKGLTPWNKGLTGMKPWYNLKGLEIGRQKGIDRHTLKGRENPLWNSIEKECIICQKKYFVQKYRSEKSRFCSHDCYHKWHIGKNSPVWTNNYKKTFKNRIMQLREYKEWRIAILERDKFICKECSSSNKIDIHHIKSMFSILRDNKVKTVEDARNCKELWDIDNGVSLCEECHRKTDSYLKKV